MLLYLVRDSIDATTTNISIQEWRNHPFHVFCDWLASRSLCFQVSLFESVMGWSICNRGYMSCQSSMFNNLTRQTGCRTVFTSRGRMESSRSHTGT